MDAKSPEKVYTKKPLRTLMTLDQFAVSDEYQKFKKEIPESVRELIETNDFEKETGIDAFMRLLDERLGGQRIGAYTSEEKSDWGSIIPTDTLEAGMEYIKKVKLFWGLVAEGLETNLFKEIKQKAEGLAKEENYEKAEEFVENEIINIVNKLSPAIYKQKDKRKDAVTALKDEFFKQNPDLKKLLMDLRLGRGNDNAVLQEGAVGKYITEDKKDWKTPPPKEIVPGLVVTVENIRTKSVVHFEIKGHPYQKDSEWMARVEILITSKNYPFGTGFKEMSLSEQGLMPYGNGLWNAYNRPVEWKKR